MYSSSSWTPRCRDDAKRETGPQARNSRCQRMNPQWRGISGHKAMQRRPAQGPVSGLRFAMYPMHANAVCWGVPSHRRRADRHVPSVTFPSFLVLFLSCRRRSLPKWTIVCSAKRRAPTSSGSSFIAGIPARHLVSLLVLRRRRDWDLVVHQHTPENT